MSVALNEDSPGSQENARILAVAADLAYEPQETGASKFQNQLGMQARLISVGNTQAWVAGDKHNLIVAFRGTEAPNSLEGLKDWLLTDALSLLIVPEGRLGTDLAAAGVQVAVYAPPGRLSVFDRPGGRGGTAGRGSAPVDHRPQPGGSACPLGGLAVHAQDDPHL